MTAASAAAAAAAASSSANNVHMQHEAQVQCKIYMADFISTQATIEEKQTYAQCVDAVYPMGSDALISGAASDWLVIITVLVTLAVFVFRFLRGGGFGLAIYQGVACGGGVVVLAIVGGFLLQALSRVF